MADKYLDDTGLTHYHGLIKNVLASLAVGQVPSYSSSSQLPADGKYQDTGNYIKLCVTEDDNKLHRYDVPTSGYVDVGGGGSTASGVGRPSTGINSEIFNDYDNNTAGDYGHTEGYSSSSTMTDSGLANHIEGYRLSSTISLGGTANHIEGLNNNLSTTSISGSHIEGSNNIASIDNQHIEGYWNSPSTSYIHIVGNGTSSSRSNAYTLDNTGTGTFSNNVIASNNITANNNLIANNDIVITNNVVVGATTVTENNLIDSINSTYYDLTNTLTSGSTSVTISNAKIHTTSTFEFYTDKFGLSPSSASVSEGSITLEFEAQSSDVSVKVRIS